MEDAEIKCRLIKNGSAIKSSYLLHDFHVFNSLGLTKSFPVFVRRDPFFKILLAINA